MKPGLELWQCESGIWAFDRGQLVQALDQSYSILANSSGDPRFQGDGSRGKMVFKDAEDGHVGDFPGPSAGQAWRHGSPWQV